jgi:hypothetical protein
LSFFNNFGLLPIPSIINVNLNFIILIKLSTLNTFLTLSQDRIMWSILIFSFTWFLWLVFDTYLVLLINNTSIGNLVKDVNHQWWFWFNILSFH